MKLKESVRVCESLFTRKGVFTLTVANSSDELECCSEGCQLGFASLGNVAGMKINRAICRGRKTNRSEYTFEKGTNGSQEDVSYFVSRTECYRLSN